MTQLKIVDESLQISVNGTVTLVTPKNLCAIDVLALYDDVPYVSIYNKFLGNSTFIFNQPLSSCQNSTGATFNIASFIAFAEANLGFDTVGGGGGCCGVISPFKYDFNGTGIEPILGSNSASGTFATIGGGNSNTASGINSAILGGCNNNTCNFANAMVIGSNLNATQGCTTFMNCASANNLTVNCFVCSGANKVLESVPFNPSRGLFAQTSLGNQIVPASGEANLIGTGVGTLTVPANGFQIGDSFTAKLCGILDSGNSQDIRIRVKSNGNILADAGIFTLSIATNKYFELTIDFTITKLGGIGVAELFTNGQFSYNKNANSNIDGNNFALINNTSFNTTVINTLSITAQWITTNASNKIQSQNFVLTKVY